jgi:uncharacterized cupredoxin-like copper-binding protein
MASRARGLAVIALLAAVALMAAACGDDGNDDGDGGGGGGGGSTVDVTLQEFAVSANPTSVDAGEVTFEITNDGPDDVHEFVVIRTDLGVTELPTDENGAVEEEGEGLEVVDEVEELPVGESESLSVDLDAGNYVLICNIYDEEEQEAHYQEGMRTSLTVG